MLINTPVPGFPHFYYILDLGSLLLGDVSVMMYDPCTLYVNNVGYWKLVERQTIIEEIIFLN